MSREIEPGESPHIRTRILQAAIRLFGEAGFEGTSLQAIAEAVGIRKPSLLYHFRSKADLRQAAMEKLLTHWKRELPQILSSATSGHDRFSSTLTAVVEFFLQDANRARLIAREMLNRPAVMREMLQKHLQPWMTLVTDYVRLGQEIGLLREEVNPEAYIMQISNMVIATVGIGGTTAAMFDAGEDPPLEPQLTELVRIARCALFVDRPPAQDTSQEAL